MTKKALTLALEALEKERPYLGAMPALTSKAITEIKEALSELEQDDEVLGFNGWGFPIEKPNKVMTTQTEALDMITKLRLAHQAMEAACERIDQLKAENKALKEALAKPEHHTLTSRVNDVRLHKERDEQRAEAMKMLAQTDNQGKIQTVDSLTERKAD